MQSLECITDHNRFAAIAPEWDRLAMKQRTPFLTYAWLDVWYRAFAGAHDLLVARRAGVHDSRTALRRRTR